jgi:hypothetical protein
VSVNWNEIWVGQISLLVTETHLVYCFFCCSEVVNGCHRIALVLDVSQIRQKKARQSTRQYHVLCSYVCTCPCNPPPFMQIVGFGLGSNPLELFGWPVTTSVGWLVIEFPTRLSTRLSIRFFEKLAVGYR